MSQQLQERIQWFHAEYLDTPAGQKHLATIEAEPDEVQQVVEDIRAKHQAGEDITDDVLRRLLPHTDTEFHREHDYRTSTWPCITKDVRPWFEGAGWKNPEDWPETARLLFEAIDGLLSGNQPAWDRFLASEYRRGFAAGFISPILFCLDESYPVINSKVIKTYKYCTAQLGHPDEIDAKLIDYFQNAEKVNNLQKRLVPLGLTTYPEFDIFCHFMVSKRLGGGDLTQDTEPDYKAWLFVANLDIFRWQEAFDEGGVEWTRSLGAYAQKLLRRQIRSGDRAFGYQAGPDYELCCELTVTSDPHKTADGTWATHLIPVRRLDNPIPLSVLKSHPLLSSLKFVQQTQISISGITAEQLAALDALVAEPVSQIVKVSDAARLCNDLQEAQHDTSNFDRYEALLANAFAQLGFEAEHLGGPGKPDVVVVGRLGSDTYTAIIEAKTCRQGNVVGTVQVDYGSISDHREEHTADYALLIAPAFAGGKLVKRAVDNNVHMVTTDALLALLRRHQQFPFSIAELRRLFQGKGLADAIAKELGRAHDQHLDLLELTNTLLGIFDELQRQQEESERISSRAIYFLLLGRAQPDGRPAPDRDQIDQVLALLSNPVLDILTTVGNEYILTISPAAARARVAALADVLSTEE